MSAKQCPPNFVASSPLLIFGGSAKRFTPKPRTILPKKNEPIFFHADLAYAVAYAVAHLADVDRRINISEN